MGSVLYKILAVIFIIIGILALIGAFYYITSGQSAKGGFFGGSFGYLGGFFGLIILLWAFSWLFRGAIWFSRGNRQQQRQQNMGMQNGPVQNNQNPNQNQGQGMRHPGMGGGMGMGRDPKLILQRRYARGDITKEQYESMLADLEK